MQKLDLFTTEHFLHVQVEANLTTSVFLVAIDLLCHDVDGSVMSLSDDDLVNLTSGLCCFWPILCRVGHKTLTQSIFLCCCRQQHTMACSCDSVDCFLTRSSCTQVRSHCSGGNGDS